MVRGRRSAPYLTKPQHNNQLNTFDFNNNSIRVIDIDGEPWMVATDVCHVLGFNRVDNALRNVARDQKRTLPRDTPHLVSGKNRLHGNQSLISESGFYRLVNRSKRPEAEEFQNWVERVVLPAIRKDGGYVMGEEKVVTGEMSEDELAATADARRLGATIKLGSTIEDNQQVFGATVPE